MKSGISIIIILLSALYFFSFSYLDKESSLTPENSSFDLIEEIGDEEVHILLKSNCYVCHNPKVESHDDLLAPPLAGIKHRYKNSYPERAEFIDKMASYILEPSKKEALMKGPIKKFGIMPNTVLEESDIRNVVGYIYDNKLEVPGWFAEHFEDMHGEKWNQ